LIEISASLRDGFTQIRVSGHERSATETGDGGRVCAAVSAITRTAILGLHAVAEEYPDFVSITITEE
jgi:uncharacterized protein YsxB (DUF464 family)